MFAKAIIRVLQLLKQYRPSKGGVIHGFSGSIDLAQQYVRLGFYLGIGGTISYTRAQKTRATAKALPLSNILLETDSPDMPIAGRQGLINSPEYLPEILQELSGIEK